MKKLFSVVVFLFVISLYSQEYFPKNDGVKTAFNVPIAFENAMIHVNSEKIIKKGTLIIFKGKIIEVGKGVKIPNNAIKIDLEGKSVYPSFIDAYSSFGINKPKKSPSSNVPQYDAGRDGYYWNDHIRSETNPINIFKFDDAKAKELLKLGFGVVNTHLSDGIVRGNGILVAINPNATNATRIIESKSAQYLSFKRSIQTNQMYPTSLMGSMALLRQMYLDADWYSKGNIETKDLSLEAIIQNKNLVQIIDAGNKLNILRADKVGDEFGIQYTIVGGGNEYENPEDIKDTGATIILPINYRKAYDVSNPNTSNHIDLSDMKKWNQEPANLQILDSYDIPFSISTHNLEKLSDFNKNLQKSISYGFSKSSALKSLTEIPAKILGKENEIGTLEVGKIANFLITSGDVFDAKTILFENWVQGSKNIISDNLIDINGNYALTYNDKNFEVSISGKPDTPKIVAKKGDKKITSKITRDKNWLSIIINVDSTTKYVRLQGRVDKNIKNLSGTGFDSNENTISWNALFNEVTKEDKTIAKKSVPKIFPVTFPNLPYGFSVKPKQETILFKNVTIWTNEAEGILKNTDVLIVDGKISKIGTDLKSSKAIIVDGEGKHLTSGIIDEHSHITISGGGNEAGHNCSAEVTIEDIISPDDTNIYRSLAGGVTTAQILHGSANPIGGRSALIKLKWGEPADNLLYKNNDKFIKFALGENVKQSNWGSNQVVRFPQTRMGVEQVYIDYFQQAKEYETLKISGKPYRKSIEMETLVEILNGKRFITCHSYIQSEINMLMKVAEKFNFTINTYTHILEGYKVADKMKKHGVGASTFSDWWAYKYEVIDAIPYNASIMHKQGITVAINSDDPEMQRRLNQEAAKSIKYGGLTEEEAWKLVTLNPAKLLHIEDRVGSIKIGKDADLVLWSDNPLSIYAKVEKTFIEGIEYFDIKRDSELQEIVKEERNTLINLMLKEKLKGNGVQQPKKKIQQHLHCDTILDY